MQTAQHQHHQHHQQRPPPLQHPYKCDFMHLPRDGGGPGGGGIEPRGSAGTIVELAAVSATSGANVTSANDMSGSSSATGSGSCVGSGGSGSSVDASGSVVTMCQCLSVLDPFPAQTVWRYVRICSRTVRVPLLGSGGGHFI
jgi:hypothetical protein